MRLLRHPLFLAVSTLHFSVDVLNSQLPLLLAVLSRPLGLSNADIGLLATGYAICASLSQPLFGWLADRFRAGWLGTAGLLWMALCFAAAAVAPGAWPMALLIIGGLGSGAFHPVGASQAARRGQTYLGGRAATAASYFFLFGQAGLSLGPAFGGALLDSFGRTGLLWLCAFALPVALNAAWQERRNHPLERLSRAVHGDRPLISSLRPGRAMFLAFVLLLALRTWSQQTMITFIPKFYHDQGFDPSAYGAIAALFMGGSALGGIAGGRLGDGWGKRRAIFWSLLLSAAPLYAFPQAGGLWAYALVFMAGALTGASHSIVVVLAQALLPHRMALASGLTLGFMFASGAVGAYFSGLLAEVVGLGLALQTTAALALGAALLSLTLRPDRQAWRAVAAPAGD